ncbi:MAG TPA: hypothetical protein VIY48_11490 [Candidatus Paceibacterota bacterium]
MKINRTAVIKAVESFVITFVAVFAVSSSGIWEAPNWPAARAAAVAILPAAFTAAVRAAQHAGS